jgi:mono/diheme cytochrome c family protein
MTRLGSRNIYMACILAGAIFGTCLAEEKQTEKTSVQSSGPTSGAQLYRQHCAVCHGMDLKGTGPVPSPYRQPPDLTTLARRHGGKFPAAYVSNVLRNGVRLPAHGPAEMPVWGTDLAAKDGPEEAQVSARIKALTDYIKSFQQR